MDLRVQAARAPEHPAVVCGSRRLSYGELEALANRMAAVWRDQGVQHGDHVAMLLGNIPETLAAAWAAWRCGVYLTPMSTTLTAPELAAMVKDSGARIVLVDAALPGAVNLAKQLAASVSGPVSWLSLQCSLPGFQPIEPLLAAASPTPAAEEPPGALMMYTSGTTGAPKGVMRPLLPADWRGTPPFAADLIELFGVGGTDVRYLSTAPLYHAAPLRVALAVTAGGGTVHVMERFDARTALAMLEREAITHSQWVPTMFQRLLALPAEARAAFHAPQHRRAIHGAAPCPVPLKRAMIEWWGPILLEYYSGSEGVGLTLIDSHDWLAHPGSVGRARKGTLHIVDEAGQDVPAGTVGLVCFSGIAPFAYHKAPDKTALRTLPGGLQTFGDVGHADGEGWLYLSDRLDDMIISGGVNIYPQEIEAVIAEVPGVWECAVVGIEDQRFGERPVAFVVPQRDQSPAALEAAVRGACAARLGRFKQPQNLYLVDALPRSPTGKLLRRQLRQRLNEERNP
ncbi:MAG TPA: AMP-binding protein [Rubrivivax sp.]|nr:AMP-binding protein [Rubrivivax sp.]